MAAVAALAVSLVVGYRDDQTSACSPVDPGLSEMIASRSTNDPVNFTVAVAVENSFARGASKNYERYFVVAMQFASADGVLREGIWGVGTNQPEATNSLVTLRRDPDGASASITSIDSEAQAFTDWSNGQVIIDPVGASVLEARECLHEAVAATI
ncbi:hypothetical protein [Rhodococcus sovatensis]|uniref:DUF3558 domain-containing protein n=1 Tax=Rhodococcus sovatensis TaxID=1805840 RepID=A0ABZ2PWB4_9NOCA